MRHAYPLMLDVTDRLIVIVGGGAVAARKAAGVLSAGARRVRCVAPEFHADLPEGIERVQGRYSERHLEGAGLVFAATDDRLVNDAVVRDARQRGALVNRSDSDEAEPGDFATPAKHEDGPVVVTVSAGGSAALAAAIRDDLGTKLDPRFVRMAEAMRLFRPAIRASRLAPAKRAQVFRDLASTEALDALHAGGIEALRDWLARRHPELTHG